MNGESLPATRRINIALQGGGSHGAFSWGVLDGLLEDGRIEIDGISGTSAGALNATVLGYGLASRGREGARTDLEAFWRNIADWVCVSPVQPSWLDRIMGRNMNLAAAWLVFDYLTRFYSPYEFNPCNVNPVRDILLKLI